MNLGGFINICDKFISVFSAALSEMLRKYLVTYVIKSFNRQKESIICNKLSMRYLTTSNHKNLMITGILFCFIATFTMYSLLLFTFYLVLSALYKVFYVLFI